MLALWALLAVLSLGLSFTPTLLLALGLGLWSILGGALIILGFHRKKRFDFKEKKEHLLSIISQHTIFNVHITYL